MQAVGRAARALAWLIWGLALAAPARAEGTAAGSLQAPAVALAGDELAGPGAAVARLGSGLVRGDEPDAGGGGAGALRLELDRLRVENEALRSDVRSTDRLVGAGLLAGGMLLGALLRAAAGRRPQPRIRF